MNEENQVYLLNYNDSILVITLANLYSLCGNEILKCTVRDNSDKSSDGAVISECLFAIIKVLINLTHRFNRQCKFFDQRKTICRFIPSIILIKRNVSLRVLIIGMTIFLL